MIREYDFLNTIYAVFSSYTCPKHSSILLASTFNKNAFCEVLRRVLFVLYLKTKHFTSHFLSFVVGFGYDESSPCKRIIISLQRWNSSWDIHTGHYSTLSVKKTQKFQCLERTCVCALVYMWRVSRRYACRWCRYSVVLFP